MGFWKRPSPAKELLGEWFLRLADRSGFWVIRKRPRLLKALKWAAGTFAVFLLLAAIMGLGGFLYLHNSHDIKDSHGNPLDWSKLKRADYNKQSTVLAENDDLIGRFFVQVRYPVKLGEVPPLLIRGFIAAEDQRFYSHGGIDLRAIARAAIINHALGYGNPSGASTITQQAGRLGFAEEVPEFEKLDRTIRRKVKEAKVAIQLEERYSKDEIIEFFLNSIYFGHSVNGVAEGTKFYTGKDIHDPALRNRSRETIRYVAILVSLNKSPIKYDPIFHEPKKPDLSDLSEKDAKNAQEQYEKDLLTEARRFAKALDRYNWVMERMLKEGDISEAEYQSALFDKDDPPHLDVLHVTPLARSEFGHSVRMVKEILLIQGFSDETITSRGGLRITTSFNTHFQETVAEEVERQYQELNREITTKEKIEGSAIMIENRTGKIVALVGGHKFGKNAGESEFNRALSLRSPGSLFKVITIADAFENHGMDLLTQVCNCPFSLPNTIDVHGRVVKRWAPQNFKEKNPVPMGFISIFEVLTRSVNLGALDTARRNGIRSIIATANKMGVHGYENEVMGPDGEIWFKQYKRPRKNDDQAPPVKERRGLEPYLPTAIGASGTSLLELASAFTVLARGGTYIKPTIIQEIKDSEGTLFYQAPEPKAEKVLSERTATMITVALRAATKVGTSKISMRGIEQQVACKTGTSNGPDDLSIACYTPEYTIVTRWGYDAPKPIVVPEYMKRVSGGAETQVSGGWVGGLVARRILDRAYQNRAKVGFSPAIEEEVNTLLEEPGN